MTTQVRKSFKARKAEYEKALVEVAHSIEPREGFFVEPLYRELYPPDPEGELPGHENLVFVVDGSENELEAFHMALVHEFYRLTDEDRQVRRRVTVETIPLTERPACPLRRFTF
jgi:hypothetical protein